MERRSRSVGLVYGSPPLPYQSNFSTTPLSNCSNPFPATCSERRLSPLFEHTYYSTGRQQHQDNSCCKCDRCTSCEENNWDEQENLRGIGQVVVLNKTKKTNKNTMTKRHQTGGSQQDEGALQEGGRVLNFERRLHSWTMDMLMLAHNY